MTSRSEGAAPTTVEAVMHELRADGLAALKAPSCRDRVSSLSKRQLEEILRRLVALRSKPYCPGITDEMLDYIGGLAEDGA